MSNIDKLALRDAAEKHGDDEILALLDELEAKDKEISKLRSVIQASRKYVDVLENQLNGQRAPATDAFLAEVRAQGIKIAINKLVALAPRLDKRAVETLSMAVEHLRKGVQS